MMKQMKGQYISIGLSPTDLTCSWIEKKRKISPQFHLNGYLRTPLHHLETENLRLFNPTRLQEYIRSFLTMHALKDPFVVISLKGPGVFEHWISFGSATPSEDRFLQTVPDLKNTLWDYRYLYPTQDGKFMFYVCGIKRELLFQYQLLALSLRLNLIALTTEQMALLQLYKFSHTKQAPQAQLETDMRKHNNQLESSFHSQDITRHVMINPSLVSNLEKELPYLLKTLGLHVLSQRVSA